MNTIINVFNPTSLIDLFSEKSTMQTGVQSAPPPGKRKEIYKYEAPWTVYSMNWSVRPDKRFRLALGSFVEEYNNKVSSPWWLVEIIRMRWTCSRWSFESYFYWLMLACFYDNQCIRFRYRLLALMKKLQILCPEAHLTIHIQQPKSCGFLTV